MTLTQTDQLVLERIQGRSNLVVLLRLGLSEKRVGPRGAMACVCLLIGILRLLTHLALFANN